MKARPGPSISSPPGGALPWRLAQADRSLRLFLTAFLLVLTAGYAIGMLFVDHTTSGTPDGLAAEFRGNEDDQAHVQSEGRARDESQVRSESRSESRSQPELKFEKSPREIYTFLHNHIFSLSLLFFCVGTIFYFSSTPQRLKTFLLVEPFVAIVTTFGGIWLTWFVSPVFSWLVIISGLSMLACYVIILFLIIRELWGHR